MNLYVGLTAVTGNPSLQQNTQDFSASVLCVFLFYWMVRGVWTIKKQKIIELNNKSECPEGFMRVVETVLLRVSSLWLLVLKI